MAFADLDKDGTQDFLLQTRNRIGLFRIDASGSWGGSTLIEYAQAITEIEVIHPVDYDHDGDLDLFTADGTMYRNNDNKAFTDVGDQTFVAPGADDANAGQGHLLKCCLLILMTMGI